MDATRIHASYHARERRIFSRLVFVHNLQWLRALEIISFWLWLEDNGHKDLIGGILSLDEVMLLDIAKVALSFIETLELKMMPELPPSSRPRLPPGAISDSIFRKIATEGINYFVRVLYKAFEGTVNEASNIQYNNEHQEDELVRSMSQLTMDPRSASMGYDSVGAMGSTRGGRRTSSSNMPMEANTISRREESSRRREAASPIYEWDHPSSVRMAGQGWPIGGNLGDLSFYIRHLTQQHGGGIYGQGEGSSSSSMHIIPREDRMLFVTFSNGYPITKEELHEFFMSNYGDIDAITVEEPNEARPPLYAYVSFNSPDTLMRVLDGEEKVKFIIRGKHLWARKFIPRKKQRAPGY